MPIGGGGFPGPLPSISDDASSKTERTATIRVDRKRASFAADLDHGHPGDLEHGVHPMSYDDAEYDDDDDEGDEMDLMKVLKITAPAQSQLDQFAPKEGEVIMVEESMASYLNRKTALLMLWFPLGVSRVTCVLVNPKADSRPVVRSVVLSIPDQNHL